MHFYTSNKKMYFSCMNIWSRKKILKPPVQKIMWWKILAKDYKRTIPLCLHSVWKPFWTENVLNRTEHKVYWWMVSKIPPWHSIKEKEYLPKHSYFYTARSDQENLFLFQASNTFFTFLQFHLKLICKKNGSNIHKSTYGSMQSGSVSMSG